MRKANPELWLKNLEMLYKQAVEAKTLKDFFLSIAEYMDYLGNNPDLLALVSVLEEQQKVDCEKFEEIRQEMIDFVDKVFPILDQVQTTNAEIQECIEKIKGLKGGWIHVEGDSVLRMNTKLCQIAYVNPTTDISASVSQILEIQRDANGHVISCFPDKLSKRYFSEQKSLERIQKIRGWFAWDRLKVFNTAYLLAEKRGEETYAKGDVFESMGWAALNEDVERILRNEDEEKIYEFSWDSYKLYLQRVHRHFLNEIAIYASVFVVDQPESIEPKDKVEYSVEKTDSALVIRVKGKEIKFKRSAKKTELFEHLLSKKEVFFEEIKDELEGHVDSSFDAQKNYYEHCRGIDLSFLKLVVHEFIKYDYKKAWINKLYKKIKA